MAVAACSPKCFLLSSRYIHQPARRDLNQSMLLCTRFHPPGTGRADTPPRAHSKRSTGPLRVTASSFQPASVPLRPLPWSFTATVTATATAAAGVATASCGTACLSAWLLHVRTTYVACSTACLSAWLLHVRTANVACSTACLSAWLLHVRTAYVACSTTCLSAWPRHVRTAHGRCSRSEERRVGKEC